MKRLALKLNKATWARMAVTLRAAWVAGVLGIIAAALAALIQRAPEAPTAPSAGRVVGALTPFVEHLGYQDGSAQFDEVGCPNGEFWAVPGRRAVLGADPLLLGGASWLGPLVAQISLDTDLPGDDYALVSSIKVRVLAYREDREPSMLLVRNTVCADSDSGSGDYLATIVLPPRVTEFEVIRPGANGLKQVAVRQGEPSLLRLEVHARSTGWYKFAVDTTYRYRGEEYWASLLGSTSMYVSGSAASEWYVSMSEGEPFVRLPPARAGALAAEVNKRSPFGFPPGPSAENLRTGLQEWPDNR